MLTPAGKYWNLAGANSCSLICDLNSFYLHIDLFLNMLKFSTVWTLLILFWQNGQINCWLRSSSVSSSEAGPNESEASQDGKRVPIQSFNFKHFTGLYFPSWFTQPTKLYITQLTGQTNKGGHWLTIGQAG